MGPTKIGGFVKVDELIYGIKVEEVEPPEVWTP